MTSWWGWGRSVTKEKDFSFGKYLKKYYWEIYYWEIYVIVTFTSVSPELLGEPREGTDVDSLKLFFWIILEMFPTKSDHMHAVYLIISWNDVNIILLILSKPETLTTCECFSAYYTAGCICLTFPHFSFFKFKCVLKPEALTSCECFSGSCSQLACQVLKLHCLNIIQALSSSSGSEIWFCTWSDPVCWPVSFLPRLLT